MTRAVLTPFTGAKATRTGQRQWRKRLLPVGRVRYEGRTLNFSRDYLQDLARAFSDRAYDQVPFQLAPDDNRHTNDPERFGGEVTGAEVRPDGLWITLRPTERADRLLEENPSLGVSARIVEGYDRSDGRSFPAAIQHVLATLDPKIPQLGGWQAIEAANGVSIVIDLSGTAFEGEPEPVPLSQRQQALASLDLPADATQDEIGALMAAILETDQETELVERWADGVSLSQPSGGTAGVVSQLRELAQRVRDAHPGMATGQHITDAISALGSGSIKSAQRHLAAAMHTLTPMSLHRHGLVEDEQYTSAKRFMDEINRGLLLLRDLEDEQPREPARVPAAAATQLSQIEQAIEMSNLADELRVLEDAEPLPTRSEDRLAHLLGRIGRGSYTPQPQPGYAPAHHLDPGHPGPVTAQGNCGPSDPVGGYCMSRYHTAHCGSLSTTEMAEAVKAPLRGSAYEPLIGPGGVPFTDQHGQAATLRDAVEASMGERIGREHVFEGHPRRELTAIQRQVVLGDQDNPDGDLPMPDSTRQAARALASRLGLAGPDVSARREQARAQRDRVIEAQRLASGGRRALGTGETMQERAQRVSKPAVGELVKVDDGVSGSLPVYRRA